MILTPFPSQRVAKETIQQAIDTNARAVYKALQMIYQDQTDQEKRLGQTREDNKVGFSAFDAEILTSFAQQVRDRGWLTEKQLVLARKKIRRYWKQLAVRSGRLKVSS